MHRRKFLSLTGAAAIACLPGCGGGGPAAPAAPGITPLDPVIAGLQQQVFNYFWNTTNAANGLAPDRYPSPSFSSIAAIGFALTAYPVGVENGWVSRAAAAARVQTTLQFLSNAPQGAATSGCAGYQGFFYHFLDMQTGTRSGTSELSTLDTALLMAGVLFCGQYFDQTNSVEAAIQQLATTLYGQVNWSWAQTRPPAICLSWTPESGFNQYDYTGYDEAMILYLLALGSPTNPVASTAWDAWTSTYPESWGTVEGIEHLTFGPMFGHQYTQVWVNLRGIQDAYMSSKGLDYFENSRRAVQAQYAYALANPPNWRGYSANLWGLTACDGPGAVAISYDGQTRQLLGYAARGVGLTSTIDDGTIAPTAVLGSLPFAPELVVPTAVSMSQNYGSLALGEYGFLDAFNPSVPAGTAITQGQYVAGSGWVDTQYLGIDQGPIIAMVENYRSGVIWSTMQQNAAILVGLQRAGFTGGWLG